MNYYLFTYSLDADEVGLTKAGTQIKTYPDKVLDVRPEAFRNVPESSFSSVMPDLNYFTLDDKAKLTDVLSPFHGTKGFFVSEKLKNLLSYHRLPPHKYYQAIVKHKNKFYDNYFFMHIVWDYTEHLNYGNSVFTLYEGYPGKELERKKFNSKDYYDQFWIELRKDPLISKYLKPYLLDFLSYVDLDILKVPIHFYCSEILKNSLEDNGVTGLSIKPTNLVQTVK
jgi:hypothetical protein